MTSTTEKQFEALYRRQSDKLVSRLTHNIGRESAEDVVSRAFIKLVDYLNRTDGEVTRALLERMVAQELIDHKRVAKRRPEVLVNFDRIERHASIPEEEAYNEEAHAADQKKVEAWMGDPLTLEAVEFRHDFDLALRRLPKAEFDAFTLTAVRGLDQREAGQVLGVDHRTVGRRAERARLKLAGEIRR